MVMSNEGFSKLIEESGELIQECGKILAYGLGDHPDGKGKLIERLEDEASDVIAAILFVIDKHNLDVIKMEERIERKLEKFMKWDKEE